MLVEKLFRKDIHSLEKTDLNTLIGVPESKSIEFKLIKDNDPALNRSELKKKEENDKENILKSVVAFLNSNNPGLLVLGVKTENEIANRISGVKKDVLPQLNREISLEDFIKEKVKAIPSFLKGYSLDTKIVDFHMVELLFLLKY
ncbi:MAG: Divergent AAA domain protein [Candidatus Methanofastidiosum methylothiophilum]|jgi:predicted HTH transcriptional regulator|uniref:Divergent AAA domain protein n=1 Tax=Candidatus Methanofastidiosum methylothiophilum TaxID=1705564 RepID=A0A150IWL0_9EURY|nr:MAG: Divergent AAA domain protein [Candidatus Methanofastidiosum methylthiophilus]KYC49350.1 MAG: Divergent AAA domain protein [Candidatus Methanofastidiosum methylthiophilus]